jgi:4'-phosphopantetheinyl transferase
MDRFVTAPATTAATLDHADVQVWHLPYRHGDGRLPLRQLLGASLQVDPDTLTFEYGPHGRPRLTGPHAGLDFSWSHSGDSAMLAMARDLPELGVDIEQVRRRARALDLARRYFADAEHVALQTLPEDALDAGFLALWTAKEAVLKGLGRGLAYGLDRVAFDLEGAVAKPRRFADEAGPACDWILVPLQPRSGVLGTVAWRGGGRPVRRFSLQDG